MTQWKIPALEILEAGPVVPVMVIHDLAHAMPLARALVAVTEHVGWAKADRPCPSTP